MKTPTLYIFSGLPGTGKSTLARMLATHLGAMYVRIDTVEQGLWELCGVTVTAEGYHLSYRIIRDNLKLGISAISDSVNPIEITRNEWQQVAENAGAKFVNIEISCSDEAEHEQRVTARRDLSDNSELPTWAQVKNRHYDHWKTDIIRVDTAGQSEDESFEVLIKKLGV